MLERGIIYFFFRGRVGPADTDPADQQPSSVADVARSYLILRPVSDDGGPAAAGSNNSRLLMLPKKSLPLRPGRDRAVAVVEKSSSSPKELVESLGARDYETKTVGKRHEPAVTPAAEGVYALTRPSGNQEEDDGVQGPSHLAYLVTFPQELGEVQRALGLQRRGTLLVSTRNPEFPAPRNQAAPGAKAEYPKA